MQVHTNIDKLPVFKNAVITIGTFDGVHTGHRQILRQMRKVAKDIDGETVVITFHPHPKTVITDARSEIRILNTINEKIELLAAQGIDHLAIIPFTSEFAELSAQEYIRTFLVKYFTPHTIIIGYDHRFGKGRKGDHHLLVEEGKVFNFLVKDIPAELLKEVTISSTKIRESLLSGDVSTAGQYLGQPYFFSGTVVEGNKLGRTIGYPTANIKVEDEKKLVPGNGVYAVTVVNTKSPDIFLKGMMNIGTRPTVDGSKRAIEVNIFNFDEQIYGNTLCITIKERLRSEVKFNGLEALKEQLAKDAQDAEKILRNL